MATLRRKPVVVEGSWLLTDHGGRTALEWMFDAIAALTPLGWLGTPLASAGGGIDKVEFNKSSEPMRSPRASMGDWIILDSGVLKVMGAEECAANYDIVEELS